MLDTFVSELVAAVVVAFVVGLVAEALSAVVYGTAGAILVGLAGSVSPTKSMHTWIIQKAVGQDRFLTITGIVRSTRTLSGVLVNSRTAQKLAERKNKHGGLLLVDKR